MCASAVRCSKLNRCPESSAGGICWGKCALCLAVLLPQPIKHLIQVGLQEQAERDTAVGEGLRVWVP